MFFTCLWNNPLEIMKLTIPYSFNYIHVYILIFMKAAVERGVLCVAIEKRGGVGF